MTSVANNRALVFGGRIGHLSGDPLNDLWLYDFAATQWSHVTISGGSPPPPRWDHCAVALDQGKTLFVFGGSTLAGELNDSWLLRLP